MSLKQPHICLDDTLGIRYAILPGDPARLDRIALQMSDVKELAYNREFRSMKYQMIIVKIIATTKPQVNLEPLGMISAISADGRIGAVCVEPLERSAKL